MPERHCDATWMGLARELLAIPLLSSSNTSIERFGCKELCLKCDTPLLDSFGFHAMQCPSPLQTVLHTRLKNALFDFVTSISHAHGSCVTSVEKEEPGLVDGNLRPGDVSFKCRGRQFAVDVSSVDSCASTNMDKCVEDLFVEAVDGKQARYAVACADQDVTFFTFGIDVMGRMSGCAERFIRWLCNCVPDPVGGRSRLVHYWSRRMVVASMIGKMDMLLKRQRSMSPC